MARRSVLTVSADYHLAIADSLHLVALETRNLPAHLVEPHALFSKFLPVLSESMPVIAGVKVWIECDGDKLEEYNVQQDDLRKLVTCYVPCRSGKDFSFAVCPLNRDANIHLGIKFDGARVRYLTGNDYMASRDRDWSTQHPIYYGHAVDQRGFLHNFKFASLTLTDEVAYLRARNEELGDLVVDIFAYDYSCDPPNGYKDRSDIGHQSHTLMQTETKVHEALKKCLKTCAKLSPSQDLYPLFSNKWKDLVGRRRLGTIIFKYRELERLIADGLTRPKIIKPKGQSRVMQTIRADTSTKPPSSKPLMIDLATRSSQGVAGRESVIEITDESDGENEEEEIARLKARVAKLEKRKRRRTSKFEAKSPRQLKKIKVEEELSGVKSPRGDIIDLT